MQEPVLKKRKVYDGSTLSNDNVNRTNIDWNKLRINKDVSVNSIKSVILPSNIDASCKKSEAVDVYDFID